MENQKLIKYYNKFCEDKRLNSGHGKVEFFVTMEWLKQIFKEHDVKNVLDVGAGTGRYTYALMDLGYDVTAVELVKYNLGVLKSKNDKVKAFQGDAKNLKRFKNESFDAVLLFGPLYHLLSHEDKLCALREAKRVVKNGGLIFISYLMADYAILMHGFKDGNILKLMDSGLLDSNFNVLGDEDGLYSYVRLDEIKKLSKEVGLSRVQMIAQDGPADYMRAVINKLNETQFAKFVEYQLKNSAREELLGASSHVLDILIKN